LRRQRIHHLGTGRPRHQLHAAGDDLAVGQLLEERRIAGRLEQPDEYRAWRQHVQLGPAAGFRASRTLDLQHHLRGGKNLLGRVDNLAADGSIGIIGKTSSESGVAFDDHAVAGARQLRHDFRYERDTSFSARDLSRDAYQHSLALLAVMYAP